MGLSLQRQGLLAVLVLTAAMLALPSSGPAESQVPKSYVAANDAQYQLCGRVFPDPQAFWPSPQAAPHESPWAKGNAACRPTDFLSYDDVLAGLAYLEQRYPDLVTVFDLSKTFDDVLDRELGDGFSAGLPIDPSGTQGRNRAPLHLLRITDEADTTVPIADRDHFVFILGMHGIERAGVEGGIRAAEDLVTWVACERDPDASPSCAFEQPFPHPVLETMPDESLTAGEILTRSSVYFVLANPDGWIRGDTDQAGLFYTRYNGNGVDLNRDWPEPGFIFRPYTPWSEPETRTFGKVLKSIKETWTGGIDLHGMLTARAFSYTLLGASQRPFGKNERVLQFTRGAWEDAETRLQWHTLIKPNDEPEACVATSATDVFVSNDPNCDPTNRIYGVQWGTIWDTINYTVTGAMGNWLDSDFGLGADGINNEMSMSHLSNCGTGKCFLPDFEQLHVDGNKSLIYAMLNFSMLPYDDTFRYRGEAAYIVNPRRLTHPGDPSPQAPHGDLPPQDAEDTVLLYPAQSTYEFEVKGPADGFYNGGVMATLTYSNVQGVSPSAVLGAAIDRHRHPEGQLEGEWQPVATYYNQSPIYLQAGQQVEVNFPEPGLYRLRLFGPGSATVHATITFTTGPAWPDPGQLPYDASNMDFFTELRPFLESASKLTAVTVDEVLSGAVDLNRFDTLIAVDDAFLPGYSDAVPLREVAQETVVGSVTVGPGAPFRTAASTAFFEFDVETGNAVLEVVAESTTSIDPDLFLQRQNPDGSWSSDLASGTSGALQREQLTYQRPRDGRYRVEVHNWAGAPGPVDLTVTFYNADGEPGPGGAGVQSEVTLLALSHIQAANAIREFTTAEADAFAARVRAFVEQGGNLVLTDDSLRALEWMGLVPKGTVLEGGVYAGNVQFTADRGSSPTWDDGHSLTRDVFQRGAAVGPNYRLQVTEPVPIGYAIQNEHGGDMNSQPQWSVDRAAWEDAGGIVLGVVRGDEVTFGELSLGHGVVRIAGALVPYPTDEFYNPYGLSSYGVTFTGYTLVRNLLDWENPTRAAPGDTDGVTAPPAPDPPAMPATGGGAGAMALLALLGALLLGAYLRRVRAPRGPASR